jgi:hypothetical protein
LLVNDVDRCTSKDGRLLSRKSRRLPHMLRCRTCWSGYHAACWPQRGTPVLTTTTKTNEFPPNDPTKKEVGQQKKASSNTRLACPLASIQSSMQAGRRRAILLKHKKGRQTRKESFHRSQSRLTNEQQHSRSQTLQASTSGSVCNEKEAIWKYQDMVTTWAWLVPMFSLSLSLSVTPYMEPCNLPARTCITPMPYCHDLNIPGHADTDAARMTTLHADGHKRAPHPLLLERPVSRTPHTGKQRARQPTQLANELLHTTPSHTVA